ncbi:endonuclease/exonuclease/phosphatase family protein [Dactylosporangium sp. CA-139066]|uniref:endonuclease/exonuclease/phosphatase family protein n=1 Tax=Dactylosporangium sp. CA-139066 TaxID=3239930 RepID=UPI003D9503B0
MWVIVIVAALLVGHRLVPDRPGHLGSLVEAFLPWAGLAVVGLFELAVWRRNVRRMIAALVPAVVWLGVVAFPAGAGTGDLLVVQHNVSDENADPAGTARALAEARPDLIGLEEVTPEQVGVYERELGGAYPFHAVYGTVGLWSRYRIIESAEIDIKPHGLEADWRRGLRALVATPGADSAVFVAHLPSVRAGLRGFNTEWRDDSARKLGKFITDEATQRVVLIGDLNASVDDRGLRPVISHMHAAPAGYAWSFPARMPIARIDQVMVRGGDVASIRTLAATGSDHRPVAAAIRFDRV